MSFMSYETVMALGLCPLSFLSVKNFFSLLLKEERESEKKRYYKALSMNQPPQVAKWHTELPRCASSVGISL
jgi:hypothetical protein